MGLHERIQAARSFDPARYVPFNCDGTRIGFVRRDLVRFLERYSDRLTIDAQAIVFRSGLDGTDERSAAMADIAHSLRDQGLLTPWRNETYDIRGSEAGSCLFRLERAAVRFFGFLAQAVHVNGLVRNETGMSMWIGRRSPDKAIDPGKLDNMVGGGLASGLSIHDTLVKEAWEEAGIPAHMAATASAAGSVLIQREVVEGLHAEIIHIYDLFLPAEFRPANQDGEVAELRAGLFADVLRELEGDANFTVDAALVALDCLVRHNALDSRWSAAIRAPLP